MSLSKKNKVMRKMIPETQHFFKVDWRPLLEPRIDYQDQDKIAMHRIDIVAALAICIGLDLGKIVRTLGGEYTGAWINVEKILAGVQPVVTSVDHHHIERIFTQGCPSHFEFAEESSSKLRTMARGNHTFFTQDSDIVNKVINEEDMYSHLLSMHEWVCMQGPNFRHNSQGMVTNIGKNLRLVWDGSTKYTPMV
jgi:hypothetical protein